MALYARALGRCERCGCGLDDSGMEAHHRKLRSQGGGHSLCNLLGLCPSCHRWVHAHPEDAKASGWIVPSMKDPAMWAAILHDGRTVRLQVDGTYDVVFDTDEEEPA